MKTFIRNWWLGALFVAIALPSSVLAEDNENVGTSVYQFLRVGVGARAAGLGGAITSVSDDAGSIFWNPAGLAMMQRPEVATNYLSYFSGVDAGGAAFGQPVSKVSTVGVGIHFLRIGGIPTTTVDNPTGESLDDFSVSNLAASLAYATKVKTRLLLGISGTYIYEGVSAFDGFSSTAGTINAGAIYLLDHRSTTIGASMRNLGGQFTTYSLREESMPLTFAGGVSTRALSPKLLLALDVEMPRDNDVGVALGGEAQLARGFFARLGYRSLDARVGDETTSNGDLAGLSLGLGFSWSQRSRLDYAYSSFADLGDAHRVSFAFVTH